MTTKNFQPTYKRQRFLLDFVKQLQTEATATDLQKLIFLHTASGNSAFYTFVPYKFGPYSFQLAEDINILRRDGYLTRSDARIFATDNQICEKIFHIASDRGDHLIRKVYREHPYYSINSEIIERLFPSTEAVQFKNQKKKYKQTEQVLFTMGYEGKSLEEFINLLIKNDIRLLCDVRKNPISRKFGFSKAKIQHILQTIGICYVHIPELGIESEKRTNLDTINDYQTLFLDYEATLSDQLPYLNYAYTLLCENVRMALMCYEKDPQMCHRHVIRDYMISTYNIRSVDL